MKRETINATIPLTSNFEDICLNLMAQGFVAVDITYSGSGDDGSLETPMLIRQSAVERVTEDGVKMKTGIPYDERYAEMEKELRELFEDKIHNQILDSAPDWYNGDGGGGSGFIFLADATYYVNHYVRIVQTDDSVLEGKLKN